MDKKNDQHEVILLVELIALALLLTIHVFLTPSTQDKSKEFLSQTPITFNIPKSSLSSSTSLPRQEPQTINNTDDTKISEVQPTPVPLPIPTTTRKKLSIALFGDSMIDTMGEHLDYLNQALKKKYPQQDFLLYNYGIGSENVVQGLKRMEEPLVYQNRNYPPLSQANPDILIMGSFGYNPFAPHDIVMYKNTLVSVLTKAKKITPNVYVLSEIAPLKKNFGKGKNGVNWPEEKAYEQATHIIEQLETAQEVAKSLNIPVIDAFHPSIAHPSEKEGNLTLVNSDDNIHPSVAGHTFIADKITSALSL